MAAKTDYIRARVTPELKASTQAIFESIGLSTTDAIVLFLKQVEMKNGIPFELTASDSVYPSKVSRPLPKARGNVDVKARLERMYTGKKMKGDAVAELLSERYQ